jgi:SAM-dependent methyltransferase
LGYVGPRMRHAMKHRLYERAVQTPELDVELVHRVFARHAGRVPLTLREDFCGTALLSSRWVESDDDREAVAVDVDPSVLAFARAHNVAPLEDDAERLTLVCGDVRTKSARTFDVITAMNFSWAIFDDGELDAYLASAAACLEDDGMLVLELFGGSEMRESLVREHPLEGFTYVWEQRAKGDRLDATIAFELDGRRRERAFSYRFHLRSIDALRAKILCAGFASVAVYVEDERGRHRKREREPRTPLWRGILVAARGRKGR